MNNKILFSLLVITIFLLVVVKCKKDDTGYILNCENKPIGKCASCCHKLGLGYSFKNLNPERKVCTCADRYSLGTKINAEWSQVGIILNKISPI